MSREFGRRAALKIGGVAVLGAAAAAAGATSAGAAPSASAWIDLTVITANIGRKNLGAREAAIRAVRGYSENRPGYRPLVGWQEISEGDTGEPAMIAQHFAGLYDNRFLRHDKAFRVPISIPKPWRVVDWKANFAHGGVEDVSPPRWLTEVVVRHESHPTLEFAMINTHYIAGAHNGSNNGALRPLWNKLKGVHKDRVLHHHNAGRPVIWTADTNNPNYGTATGRDIERQAFTHDIDRIDWMPGNGTVALQLRDTRTVPMHVDGHNARVARFRVRVA